MSLFLEYNGHKFFHGDAITCTIEGTVIDDAKISILSDASFYICQNQKRGSSTLDKLGYRYSWCFSKSYDNKLSDGIKDLNLLLRDAKSLNKSWSRRKVEDLPF